MLPYGDLAAIERAMNPNVAAVLVEPIQGESGIHLPPAGYLRGIEALCKKHNVLFVCDEIQSGLGRTGKFFCFQHEGVRPDIVIVGKALSGGFYPVSAILADDPVMLVFKPGDHGSTFGGNPLAAAVAREALKVLVDEKMIENSATHGRLLPRASCAGSRASRIKEVRGKGLWIGLELDPRRPAARAASARRCATSSCSARKPTSTRSASRRRSTSRAKSWTGRSSAIEAVFRELA